MLRTYRALADTIGTSWQVGEGFVIARSNSPHPILNFGFVGGLTPYSAQELGNLVEPGSANIYCLSTDERSAELLQRNGFTIGFSMINMTAKPLVEAEMFGSAENPDRREVAEFMVRQFFQRRDAGYQSVFCDALAGAVGLPIVCAEERRKLVGAALLSPQVLDEPVGVFNFCVDARYQRKGLGTRLLSKVRAHSLESPVCVQCAQNMVSWYGERAFSPTETVYAFRNGA